MAGRLNLTNLDPEFEEDILLPEEKEARIEHEKALRINHRSFKWAEMGLSKEEIAKKVSEIDWATEIDTEEILRIANSRKHQDLWHKKQREREKEVEKKAEDSLRKIWDAKNMYKLMKQSSLNEFGKDLIVNPQNKGFITALCFFLSEDERFETQLGFSFKKGLLIRGASGLGKTHLVRCLETNGLNPILVLSMLEITDEVKANGEYAINLGKNKVIYLDDVGTEEPVVNHYGTKISFFKNFIELVYLKNKVFNKLMISTNNDFQQIEEKYGFRVRSRMKDMFNIIDVKGKDMRG